MSSRKFHTIEKASDFENKIALIKIEDMLDMYTLNTFTIKKTRTT